MGSHLSSMVFQPPEVTYVHEGNEMIWLRTQGNVQIPAFYIPQPGAKLTILFSHGNAEDLGSIYEWFLYFSEKLKVNVFAYDYDGYGKASGVPSDQACYEDIEAAYLYLKNTLHIPSEHIVLYGRSLGSGPSLYLAEKLAKGQVRLGGVILQVIPPQPFTVSFFFISPLRAPFYPYSVSLSPFVSLCPLICSLTLIVFQKRPVLSGSSMEPEMKLSPFGMENVYSCIFPLQIERNHFG